jgi:N-acetylglucosamine malate deacetylase 1
MFYPTLDVTGVAPLEVLAVGAHPGDAEWFCGGTLSQIAKEEIRVGVLDLSTGDMSARGIPQQRVAEAEAAASALGLAWRGNLGLPDGRLENNIMARMSLAAIIRSLQPRIVIGPHPNRHYPDHRYAWEMLRDACAASAWPKLDDVLAPHQPDVLLQGAPDLLATATIAVPQNEDSLASKCAALACYRSQMDESVGRFDTLPFRNEEDLRAQVQAMAAAWASGTACTSAEPFFSEVPLVLASLSLLRVASH